MGSQDKRKQLAPLQNGVVYKLHWPELIPSLRAAVEQLRVARFTARIYEGVFSHSSVDEWHSKIFVACSEDELVLAPLHAEDHGELARRRLPGGAHDDDGAFLQARSAAQACPYQGDLP